MQNETRKSGFPRWLRILLIGRNLKWTLARAAALATLCAVAFTFILLPTRVTGISMLPTYKDRSWNFVNRLSYLRHEPRRGDVVGIRLSGSAWSRPSIMYMKRIIGLPGETVGFAGGHVLIDGKSLDEPYMKSACNWNYPVEKLKPDEYFVVGDNRTMPWQDHTFGKTPRWKIVGKVLL